MRKRTFCNHVNQHYYDAAWKDTERDVFPYDTIWDSYYGTADAYEEYQRWKRKL